MAIQLKHSAVVGLIAKVRSVLVTNHVNGKWYILDTILINQFFRPSVYSKSTKLGHCVYSVK